MLALIQRHTVFAIGHLLALIASDTSLANPRGPLQNQTPSLIVVGDSLTSGVMANTQLGDWDDFRAFFGRSFSVIDDVLINRLKRKNFKPERIEMNFQNLASTSGKSFFFTDDDWGLRAHIAQKHGLETGSKVNVMGAFAWGKKYSDIDELMQRIERKEELVIKGQNFKIANHSDAYVAIGLGGNDACYGKSPDKFKEDVLHALDRVKRSIPLAHIIMIKLPNFEKLHEIDHEYRLKIDAGTKVGGFKVGVKQEYLIASCGSLRRQYCDAIESYPNAWSDYNMVLDEVIAQYSSDTPISVIEGQKLDLDASMLGVDCFHPSEKGHRSLGSFLDL